MQKRYTLGIDEAGRGSVLGPLVLCGVLLESAQEAALRESGVQDSKRFGASLRGRQMRRDLAEQIRAFATVYVEVADAASVDRAVENHGLNRLEQALAQRIIAQAPPNIAIVADGKKLFEPLKSEHRHLITMNCAEDHCIAVAAASIVAKSIRDQLLDEILAPHQHEFGPIRGGGYPNSATACFLRTYTSRRQAFPPHVRQTWSWPVLQEILHHVLA